MVLIGRYINLDRAVERRTSLEAHLASLNPPQSYRRFAAIDGATLQLEPAGVSAGNMGCYHSHRAILREYLDEAADLHILEDDARMAMHAPFFLGEAMRGPLREFDILFTDSVIPTAYMGASKLRQLYDDSIQRGPDGKVCGLTFTLITFTAGTSSYLLNRSSVRRLHDLLDAEIKRGPVNPIDVQIRLWGERGALRVACLFPFITTIQIGNFDSAIDGNDAPKTQLATDLLRYSFFVEREIGLVQTIADRHLRLSRTTDLWARLHVQITGFLASDDYDGT